MAKNNDRNAGAPPTVATPTPMRDAEPLIAQQEPLEELGEIEGQPLIGDPSYRRYDDEDFRAPPQGARAGVHVDRGDDERFDGTGSSETTYGEEREMSDQDRLDLFRMASFQNQLPTLPEIPGYHGCWLTTANPRDPIQGRLKLGYELLRADDPRVPGWEHSALLSGQFLGYVGVNEMVAAILPLRLYEMYMTEAHHNQPLAEEGKLRSTLDAIKNAADSRAPIVTEEGTAQLGMQVRRPRFEGLEAPRARYSR